ncbi:MAG: carbohydrate binding family 9 domain-containing protein [Nitrospira sp.]|nr:carbohydrate binding family 9 domain-containing protein [Nitrospira sp.]
MVTVLAGVLLTGGWFGAMPTEGADLLPVAPLPVDASTVKEALNRVRMVKTKAPPDIDGRLSESAWEQAAVVTEFTQAYPNEGTAPSARTEVRLLFDADYLYIGIRAFDSEPDQIVAKERQRDIEMDGDDYVAVALDPFHDLRRGYYFQVNPLGNRRDGLISPYADTEEEDGLRTLFEWDGIWYAEAVIDDQGWTAELAIPMKTISFDPDQTTWGFNVERAIARKNEYIRWTAATRTKQVVTMGDAGQLDGLTGLRQGLGVDFVPYARLTARQETPGGNAQFPFELGGDLYYKVTPSVTAALTVNTDFAQTEVDDRRVNLTRFPLFFPEKRRFFLQDSNYFQFAGGGRMPLPFFSRRIGLDADRMPIDLLGGLKVTGQIGRTNIGLLSIQSDKTDDLNSKNLAVGRASVGFLDESSVGVIFTNGNPLLNAENRLGGADLNLKSSNFLGSSQVAEMNAYVMRSDGEQSGNAFGGRLLYPNFTWDAGLTFDQLGTNFNPALGFIEQAGTRNYSGWLGRSWRPTGLDSVRLGFYGEDKTMLDGRPITGSLALPEVGVTSTLQDSLYLAPVVRREQYFEPFEIAPGVIIPPGEYSWLAYNLFLESAKTRAVRGSIGFECCAYLNGGQRMDLLTKLVWRPSPWFNLAAIYTQNRLALPDGKFTVHIGQLNLNMTFTRNLSWNLIGQYDNVSNEFGLNSRMRWAVQPGSDVFLVFNHNADTENGWHSKVSELIAKLVWTIRF